MTNQSVSNEQSDELASPLQTLYKFMAAMNQWEREAHQESQRILREGGSWAIKNQKDLEAMHKIFAQYCTPKDRPLGRQGSFSHPPEYDPETEQVLEIVEESKRRVVIFTQEGSGFQHKNRYVLLRKGDKWLIDNKQWLDLDGKWQKRGL